MTQPPEDRRPETPEGEGGPENEPTVAWAPPEPEPGRPADDGGAGYAAIPDDAAPSPPEPAPAPPAPPTEPPSAPPAEAAPPPAEPTGPIISAAPTPPPSGWQTPGQPPPTPTVGSGWEVPAPAAAVSTQEGDVIAGVGARIVAWLIDTTLAGIIPGALSLAVMDWAGMFTRMFEQLEQNPTGQLDPNTFTFPITLDFILANLIGVGILYLYFVGFWTSRWRATPGMIFLKMRVVDAASGGTLSISAATKRWIALGFWLPVLGFLPALQSAAGLIQFALIVFLFFTTVTNDRRQGVHDKWANSLVIRSVTSGNGATFAGCLAWGVLVIVLGFLVSTLVLAAAWPSLEQYVQNLPTPAP